MLTPGMLLSELERLRKFFNVRLSVKNGEFISYSVTEFEKDVVILVVQFYEERLIFISIFLKSKSEPFVISGFEQKELLEILMLIGGVREYDWGRVELAEDRKGGTVSICINYQSARGK